MALVFQSNACPGFGNSTPLLNWTLAILVDRVIFAGTICGLEIRQLILAHLNLSLARIFFVLGPVRNSRFASAFGHGRRGAQDTYRPARAL
jgi:hypothetical protein